MVKSRTLTLLGLLLTASCDQDPKPLTQLVLVADTDIATLDAVRFVVHADDNSRDDAESIVPRGAQPAFVSVIREEGTIGTLTVSAMGLVNGENAGVVRTQRVSFVPDQTRVVQLHLAASCARKACAGGETCSETGCVPVDVPEQALGEWTGEAPRIGDLPKIDAGMPATDGGKDAAVVDAHTDAATPTVDATADAATEAGPSDAGPIDAGPPADSGLTACESGWFDLKNDPQHCGVCTKKCPELNTSLDHSIYKCLQGTCSNEKCLVLLCDNSTQCQPLYGDCNGIGGCETALGNDVNNCGACGKKCSDVGKTTCTLGVCQ